MTTLMPVAAPNTGSPWAPIKNEPATMMIAKVNMMNLINVSIVTFPCVLLSIYK